MCQIESQVCMPHLRKCAPHDWHNPICLACEPVEFSFPSFLLLFFVWFIFQAVNAVCWLLDEFMQLKSYLARSQLPKKKKTPTFSSMCVLTKAGSTSKDRKEILLIKAARPECADPSCCFQRGFGRKEETPVGWCVVFKVPRSAFHKGMGIATFYSPQNLLPVRPAVGSASGCTYVNQFPFPLCVLYPFFFALYERLHAPVLAFSLFWLACDTSGVVPSPAAVNYCRDRDLVGRPCEQNVNTVKSVDTILFCCALFSLLHFFSSSCFPFFSIIV